MKLVINSKEKDINCNTVSDLLKELNLNNDIVAVELNKNIVHRENFEKTKLKNNDKIEIVTVVGGG
ncbi:MAG: sulfur carrier protein ThiS [Candidatus Woesearchaeota archaeon]|jgi:sulfur carrier protein|nr:sulfur carrier protein ThiS [Candidatus Woesearchaeota archaeon]MDP7622819.1 sulfur carrier protein ThiS [Candidatus Woesearchaeota archaeon]HJN56922.1 sulfur carrier protein ThiS [Candidatus Woesearchaeota archaeon]|tara:strand:+ start:63289 stop:63486 length:198 start_codon:yes stop_codon:yes gene_type:complete